MIRPVLLAAIATGIVGLRPAVAEAQAWLPPAGSGAVTVTFQTIEHTGHRLTDGTYIDNGRSRSGGVFLEMDYALTRRFSISAGLPFVFAKYTDAQAPPDFLPFLPRDQCRCWQSGWQDVGMTARFNLVDTFDHVFAMTPSVSVGIPSHAYAYQGEAVVGRRLKELRLAVDAGYRIDAISRNVAVTGSYAYAIVERVIGVPNNRSNAVLTLDWRATPAWSISGFSAWQRTHGGLRVGSLPGSAFPGPGELTTDDRIAEHDRLLRDNRVHAGAAVSYRVSRATMSATYTHFLAGTDTHAGRAFTLGISMPFRLGR